MARRKSRLMAHCLNKPAPRLARLLRGAAKLQRLDADLQTCLPADLRGHCHIAACRDGQVLLHVDSSAWATRMRYALPELTERNALLRDADKVRVRVRVTETPPVAPSRRPNRMSPAAAQMLLDCSQHLQNPALAESLRRIANSGVRQGRHQAPNSGE